VGLVSIGEFSRLSRLSPKALRLYDELGLLVSDHVDAATGYRWYAGTQLEQARMVSLLRRISVPLAQIKVMLALDPASAAEQIRDYWAGTEEPAHQEAFVGQGRPGMRDNGAEAEVAIEALISWASEQQRQPSDVRSVLVFNPANQGAGPDTEFAVALR